MNAPRYRLDERLKEWATPRQAEYIDAVNKHRSIGGAAKALGINKYVITEGIKNVEKKAAIFGYSPRHDMSKTVPEPFIVRGVSTYYDKEGKAAGQWVKSRIDEQALEAAVKAAVVSLSADVKRADPIPAPAHVTETLCNLYTLTDVHIGARAWGKETGADWDLEIAERVVISAFRHMVQSSPMADTAIVCQLGDWMHFDSLKAVTPTNQHLLDADGRFSKVIAVAVRILRTVIDFALARHAKVVVLMAEGNHDEASSVWLRHLFKLLYEREPRIEVIDSELPYYVHQHGTTMLAFHHGHLKKNDALPILFAAQFPQIWGATTKRYCHTGHRHHVEEKEHSGMTVIQRPTLAARDAYAARGGWIAERAITAITYHRDFGQVARNTVTPEMLEN